MTAQQEARTSNPLALAGFILGIVTAALVVLRPYWLVVDAIGLLAVVFGFIGVGVANRTGGVRRPFAIWAIVLGFSPLVPLVLSAAVRLDYY